MAAVLFELSVGNQLQIWYDVTLNSPPSETPHPEGGEFHLSFSATISVTGSANGVALFLDDFEDGLDPAWQSSTYWDVIDGAFYGAGAGCVYAYVTTGVDWDDYVVEMDLTMVDSGVGVLVRCQSDLQSYVVLKGDYSSLQLNWSTWLLLLLRYNQTLDSKRPMRNIMEGRNPLIREV